MKTKAETEAHACALLDSLSITMFGQVIHNPNGIKRKFYHIHPYVKQGTGVSCTITYTDKKTKVIHVLCARKKNKSSYDQIGGYTKGQGPEGSDVNYDKRTDDERDSCEEAMIGNFNAINTSLLTPPTSKSNYTLEQLTKASNNEFVRQQREKLGKKIDPIRMKEYLRVSGINYTNDYNALDTALREIKKKPI
jgi:hypothetical protein